MEEGLSDTEDDAKMHHIGRNRKRRQNGSEEKQSSRGSSKNPEDDEEDDKVAPRNPAKRKKRHRFDSPSDADEEEDGEDAEDRNFVADPNAVEDSSKRKDATSSKNGHKFTGLGDDSDVQIVEPSDPWEHLEEYLAKLTKEFPDLDPLVIQDSLIQNEVRIRDARKALSAMITPTTSGGGHVSTANSSRPHLASKGKIVYDTVDMSEDRNKYHILSDNIYDSEEESDDDEETVDRKIIVSFLQDATLQELMKVRGLSDRKAKILIEARPFASWKEFVSAVKSKKHLNLDVMIESAKDFLNARTTVNKIIRRCQLMADKVESAIALHADDTIEPPDLIAEGKKLQGYQLVALQWLTVLHKSKMNGILADEMGLGKTIQSIAFIAYLMEHGIKGPFLVIAPASTIDNWDDEFRRWTPSIRTVVYHGSLEDRAFLRQEYFSPAGLHKMDVVITTYQGATRNIIDKAAFKRLKFDFAIYDEAHLLKNMCSQKYRALMSTIHASGRLLLTGTPVQNNLTELLSLLVFAMPEMLSKETASLEHAFTYISNEAGSAYEVEQVKEARAILKPFILRRTKEDVSLELPAKTSVLESVPMSEKQQAMYDRLVRQYTEEEAAEGGPAHYDVPTADEMGSHLEALHQMRKLANHPVLTRNLFTKAMLPGLAADLIKYHPRYKTDTVEHLAVDLEFMSDFQLHQLCMVDRNMKKYRLNPDAIMDSGKFQYLDRMMPVLQEEGRRILLFSQYVQILDIVQAYLEIRKYRFSRIDGQTPVGERQDIVDRFNTDPSVFVMLLSTRAGGLGINLTGADTVIIHDIDYNPYNDKQAENRCHRLGQKRAVVVYRLISKGTIEEKMYARGQMKLELEKNVMDSGAVDKEVALSVDEDLDVEAVKELLESSLIRK